MGYFLSFLLLPMAFIGVGICVGQMESFVHTIFFNSKGENAKPVNSFLLMFASTSPWYLAFFILHFIETWVLTRISRKYLSLVLLCGLAGGLSHASEMRRKSYVLVALVYTALHLLASVIFSLLMSLTNDILVREGGLSKRVIVWGYCISWFYAGMGVGRTLLTAFVFYKVPLEYIQFTFIFLVVAMFVLTVKRDPGMQDEKQKVLEASKKDTDSKTKSKKNNKKKAKASDSDSEETLSKSKDEKKPPADAHPSLFDKLHHTFRVSRSLLLYMVVRRVPGMLVAWKVAPESLQRLGVHPIMGLLGFPTMILISCSTGSVISAMFITRRNILPTLKISSVTASLLLLPFLGLLLNVRMIQKFFRKLGLFLIAGDSLFTGFETGFLIMYYLEINSQLPRSMRLCHLGLFAAVDRLSSHLIFTLLSAVSDNVSPVYSAVILVASIAVNCIMCLRVK